MTIVHAEGHTLDIDVDTHTPFNYRKFDCQRTPLSLRDLIDFSPDGTWVVGVEAHEPNVVKCWNRQTAVERVSLRGHQGRIDHVSISTDAERIATTSWASSRPDSIGEIKVWDAHRGKVLLQREAKGLTATRIALSPEGDRLAVASIDVEGVVPRLKSDMADANSHIRVYDVVSGKETTHIADVPDVWMGLGFSPSGDRLAAAGANQGSVLIWNFETQQRALTNHGLIDVADLAFSPNGERIAIGGRILNKVIDAQTAEDLLLLRTRWQLAPSGLNFQPHVRWSPDGRVLAVTSRDRMLSIWSIADGNRQNFEKRRQLADQRAVTHALQRAYVHHARLDNENARQSLAEVEGVQLGSDIEYWMRSRLYLQLGKHAAAKADFEKANALGLNRALFLNKEMLRPYYNSKTPLEFENDFLVPR